MFLRGGGQAELTETGAAKRILSVFLFFCSYSYPAPAAGGRVNNRKIFDSGIAQKGLFTVSATRGLGKKSDPPANPPGKSRVWKQWTRPADSSRNRGPKRPGTPVLSVI